MGWFISPKWFDARVIQQRLNYYRGMGINKHLWYVTVTGMFTCNDRMHSRVRARQRQSNSLSPTSSVDLHFKPADDGIAVNDDNNTVA